MLPKIVLFLIITQAVRFSEVIIKDKLEVKGRFSLKGYLIDIPTTPQVGDALRWDGTAFVPQPVTGGGGGISFPIRAPVSSAENPPYSFENHPRAGMYYEEGKGLGFTTTGEDALFVKNDGSVNIKPPSHAPFPHSPFVIWDNTLTNKIVDFSYSPAKLTLGSSIYPYHLEVYGDATFNGILIANKNVFIKGYTTHEKGVTYPIIYTSSSLTLTENHYTIIADARSNPITISLPDAMFCNGRVYVIKRVNTTGYDVVIQPVSGQTIDGASSLTLTRGYEVVMIQASSALFAFGWYILSHYAP